MLPSDQRRVIPQAKIAYTLLGKALENKQYQGKKQIEAVEDNGKELV